MSQKKPVKRPDWAALRLVYVNGVMSLRELAAAHGVTDAATMARAHREGWDTERKRLSAEASAAAQKRISKSRTEELAEFNAADLAISKAIKQQVTARLRRAQQNSTIMDPAELRVLASAQEAAQRIGRIALGAQRDIPPPEDDAGAKMREAVRQMQEATDGSARQMAKP